MNREQEMDWKILIVDDEPDVCKTLEKFLVFEGFQVLTATSGPQALELLDSHKVHLALLDIKMPGMNGIEVLQRLKKIDVSIQVIIMTGYSTFDLALEAFENGAADYALKPFESLDRILELIRLSTDRLERWHHILAETIKQKKSQS